MANSVLSRPMFDQQQASPPVAPTSSGIGGMTTPDQNAQALKNLFAPQIPATPPTQSFPVPGQGYKRGGEVIDGVAHFADGNEVVAPPAEPGVGTKLLNAARDVVSIPYQVYQGVVGDKPVSLTPNYDENVRRPRGETGEAPISPAQKAGAAAADIAGLPIRAARYVGNLIDPREISPVESITPNYDAYRLREAGIASLSGEVAPGLYEDVSPAFTRGEVSALDKSVDAMPTAQREAIRSGIAYSPPPKPATNMELELQSIRARREQTEARIASRKEDSIKQREENKWMSILAAGLGMMAGKDRNALANIGAGGQQGLATFAGLEKGRREEESTARREDLMREQMGQQLDIAKMQLAKDPDMIRTYAALGGWKQGDPAEKYQAAVEEGYARAHAPERIKALQSFLEKQQLNPTANPQEIQRANAELLRLGMGSSTGSQFKLLGVKP